MHLPLRWSVVVLLLALLGSGPLTAAAGAAPPATPPAVPAAVTADPEAIHLPSGVAGTALRIERDPFRLVLVDRDGEEVVATVPGLEGPPVRLPGVDGPQPIEPLRELGAFPGVGFVVGARVGVTFPIAVPFFTGNRLFGAEVGVVASAVEVTDVRIDGEHVEADLRLDAPGVGPARLRATRLPTGGVRVQVDPPSDLPAVSNVVTLTSPTDEGLYGLGGRKDAFDQRGLLRNVWVEQQNVGPGPFAPVTDAEPTGELMGPTYTFPNGPQATHFPQGVLFGSRGWAVWSDVSELQRLDLAAGADDRVRWGTARPGVSLTFVGGGLEEASRAFTASQGRAPAPPRYAYEPWISILNEGEGEAAPFGARFDGGPRVRADVEEVAAKAEELDLPIGVIGMEGWHRVPDVEQLTADLRERGFRLAAYWSPFVNEASEVYEEAVANGYLVRDVTGRPYPIVTTRGYVNHVVDFTDPAAARWWGDQLARSFDLGFEAFMNDFGELVTEGMVFASGQPPDEVHNLYPALYHAATRDGVDRYAAANPDVEPFFFVRAGYSAVGDVPGVTGSTPSAFPGDETTDDHPGFGLPAIVPMMLNLALGGSYAFTTDVGGYLDLLSPRTDAELFTRWHQASALMPLNRVHNSTFGGSVMPWDLEDEHVDTYRRFARLKVELIDLVDRWAQRAATRGDVGPVRPLVLEDPSPAARAVGDQWLLGHDLLVAPILTLDTTEREVYLPAGSTWEEVDVDGDGRLVRTGRRHDGGRAVQLTAGLHEVPLLVRVGGGEDLPFAAASGVPGRGVRSDTPAPPRDRGGGAVLPATGGAVGAGGALLLVGLLVRAAGRRRS